MEKRDFDAVVVGSGPNGLAAAILLQQHGLSVAVVEGAATPGGGMRSAELTLPGFTHDVCSAIHPMAVGSPYFRQLPLGKYGLEWIYPEIAAAHPFADGDAAFLFGSVEETADRLAEDAQSYRKLVGTVVHDWPLIETDVLGPLRMPRHPLAMARFGLRGLRSAEAMIRQFRTRQAAGLFAGMAAHSMLPLSKVPAAAIALVLMANGHLRGWPLPKGGTQQLANALTSYFISLGGKLFTGQWIRSVSELPGAHALLFDVTPRQLLEIGGAELGWLYAAQLRNYRYGMGVFKVDWALNAPIPFTAAECRKAGTIHLGGTAADIVRSERQTWEGGLPERPFVLLAQPSVFDPSRAPAGKHTAWAYCHVPQGSAADRIEAIERAIERVAPGFRATILGRHTLNAEQMQLYNPNYIGGDINGGMSGLSQLFTRPALRLSPYRTSTRGWYICSASTPPGGGVHGMCGYHAGRRALKDVFGIIAG